MLLYLSVSAIHDSVDPYCRHCRRRTSLGSLVTGVAHEINNPLAYITINLCYALEELREAIAAGKPPPLEVLASLEEAKDGAKRAASIVRNLERCARPEAGPEGGAHPEAAEAVSQRSGRVLVVTDEPLIGRSLRRMLAPQHQVEVAGDVPGALQMLGRGEGAFEVILCDLMMPGHTGVELYEALKVAHPGLAERLVLMTGSAFAPRTSELLGRFSGRRLEKPVDAAAVRRVVADVLEKAA